MPTGMLGLQSAAGGCRNDANFNGSDNWLESSPIDKTLAPFFEERAQLARRAAHRCKDGDILARPMQPQAN